jgi:hypothetical protein
MKDRNARCAIGAAEILLHVALEVARRNDHRACDRAARVSTLLTGASRLHELLNQGATVSSVGFFFGGDHYGCGYAVARLHLQ